MSQCTAQAKRTGQRCRLPTRTGYPVCSVHGAGKGPQRGGRPIIHGAYSRFLTPEETVDFAYFRAHFDLTDDLAFACSKVYNAADKVPPQQLPGLLDVPSRIALRRKQVLEGLTLKLDIDVHFLQSFVAKVLTYVHHPAHWADLLAYLQQHVGPGVAPDLGRPPADAGRRVGRRRPGDRWHRDLVYGAPGDDAPADA